MKLDDDDPLPLVYRDGMLCIAVENYQMSLDSSYDFEIAVNPEVEKDNGLYMLSFVVIDVATKLCFKLSADDAVALALKIQMKMHE